MKNGHATVSLLLLWGMVSIPAFSQEISGYVKDVQGNPLPTASIALQRAGDSALIKIVITDAAGKYQFHSISPGSYFIRVSYAGFREKSSPAFEVKAGAETVIPDIIPAKQVSHLQMVTVVSSKPIVEVKADKIILNVEGTINAIGSDALELLRKSPGVTVDRNDNLNLAGKSGVQVYIDGRPSPLTGKELADYLKTLSSVMIESIEIISNPSAKFDAAGNGGIINIRLKKVKRRGTNGSITLGTNFGIYPKYNGGISLNHNNGKTNFFGTWNITRNKNENFMQQRREVADTLFNQSLVMHNRGHAHLFKTGADYYINKKNTVGMVINGNFATNQLYSYSHTPISYKPSGTVSRILMADNNTSTSRQNWNVNVNYHYADSTVREWTMDADYGTYRLRNDQVQPNYFLDPQGNTVLHQTKSHIISPADIDILSIKTDYEQIFKKGRLSVGGKMAVVHTKNNFERYQAKESSWNLDLTSSNYFEYRENIQALYASYQRPFKRWSMQLGLRMEHTNSRGSSWPLHPDGTIDKNNQRLFERQYTDLFPSAALTFNKDPNSQFTITASRRIDRPAYQDLNPFEFKLDEYTFLKGNTELIPQYTNSWGITHTWKYKLNTNISYSKVKDVLVQLVDTLEKTKSILTKKNMATQELVSLNISYPFTIKWYTAFANLNAYYTLYQADFGPGRNIDLSTFVINIFMQHSFNLGKGWKGEVSGWYVSPSIWQGFSKSSKMWSMDAGLQKTLWKGTGNVKAALSDIFQSMRWKGTSHFAGQSSDASGGWESRLLKLSVTWRLGGTPAKEARRRKQAAEEENKRVKENNEGMSRQ